MNMACMQGGIITVVAPVEMISRAQRSNTQGWLSYGALRTKEGVGGAGGGGQAGRDDG